MADDQINVQVTADATGLETGMQQACQSVQASLVQLQQAVQDANNKIDTLGSKTATSTQQAKKSTDVWAKSFVPVEHAFTNSINGMILGTTTWQKAVQKVEQTVVSSLLNGAEQIAKQWLQSEIARTLGTETGVAERTAAESMGQAVGLTQMASTATKTIGTDAAKAASSTYATVSEIPYVGWILAPVAAGAAYAAVIGYESMISSAGGLWSVPADTLAMVHKQETILPATIAQPMRDFFTGGGNASGGGGGDNYAITIQAIDAQTGARFLMDNAAVIAKGLAREMRNGNPVLRNR